MTGRRRSGAAARRRPRLAWGFTLIEVLVVLSILGLLTASLAAAMGFSLTAWRSGGAAVDRADALDAVDRALRELITGMEPAVVGSGAAPIEGGAHLLSFRTEVPERPIAGPGPGRTAEVGLGVDRRGRLVLRASPVYRRLDGAPPVRETVLLNNVREIDLEYWDPGAGVWRTEWRARELPGLVRVRIRFPDGDGRRWPDIVAAPRRQMRQA